MKRAGITPILPLAALAGLAFGCVSAPRYLVEVDGDQVRASDPDVAADAAGLVERGRSLLAERVPDLDDTAVEVWLQAPANAGPTTTHGASFPATTVERPGRRPRIYVPSHGYRNVLQHELAHALLGEGWRTLPLAAEEGLCTLLNDEIADPEMAVQHLLCAARAGSGTMYSVSIQVRGPGAEPRKYHTFWGNSGGSDATESMLTVAEILAFSDFGDIEPMTWGEIGHVYGVGFVVVRRIVASRGIEGLHELCLRAASEGFDRIPVPWLLDAAGIESDEHLEEIARKALRLERLRAALERDSFEDLLRRAIQEADMAPSAPVDEFLTRFEGTLKIDGESVDLGSLPEFESWLRESWDALRVGTLE